MDGTFGRGGHAAAILHALGPSGRLLALDRDLDAVGVGRERFGRDRRFAIEHAPFSRLKEVACAHGLVGHVDGVLLDLGVSSPQLDNAQRGFSFLKDGPLDMRMDRSSRPSASDWVNSASEEAIAQVLREYGEERYARRVARAIVAERRKAPIATTHRLAAVTAAAIPRREPGKHPATRTFQAIRIFINRELDELRLCLDQSLQVLKAGGRLVVISFHSLEDRIVKRFMRGHSQGPQAPRRLPLADRAQPRMLKLISGAIRPSREEIDHNPGARSAVLRIAERLAWPGA